MLLHCSDQSRATPVIGWNEHVAESKAKAVLWHRIWQECGSPNRGVVYDIRKSTRATYHYAIRHAKKQTNVSQANKLADALLRKRSRDFWTEVKRIKGKSQQRPVMVDGVLSDAKISELFATKYRTLYNSVSYTNDERGNILQDIKITYHDKGSVARCDAQCICKSQISVENVKAAMGKIQSGKSDGQVGLCTDYLKYGTHKLYVYIYRGSCLSCCVMVMYLRPCC